MRLSHPPGYTFIEILTVMAITGILFGVVTLNFRRGTDDSVLARETSLLTARLRLVQEQTAAGKLVRFCSGSRQGLACAADADCVVAGAPPCQPPIVPPGGRTMLFSCVSSYTSGSESTASWPGLTQYLQFAENSKCTSGCFPETILSGRDNTQHDAMVGTVYPSFWKGDTREGGYVLDPKVAIKDLQLTEDNVTSTAYRCATGTPWRGQAHPLATGGVIPADYPLQAVVRYEPPDGRVLTMNDNIQDLTPLGNPWKQLEIMLGVVTRNFDCRVITVTNEGVISSRTDADCNLTTST